MHSNPADTGDRTDCFSFHVTSFYSDIDKKNMPANHIKHSLAVNSWFIKKNRPNDKYIQYIDEHYN